MTSGSPASNPPTNPPTPAPRTGGATWRIFHGDGSVRTEPVAWPPAPPWRRFGGPDGGPETTVAGAAGAVRVADYYVEEREADVVNAALHLHRPLLVTGRPGTGKSTLASAIAQELGLGTVLRWPVNSRTTHVDGLYRYDAIARLRDSQYRSTPPDIGEYIKLGPLGTALADSSPGHPRLLLIDEMDKSDPDLANDLLVVFEEGGFEIPELARLRDQETPVDVHLSGTRATVPVREGQVRCSQFPVVVITSNGETDFPPAFLRRCVRLELNPPDDTRLLRIIEAHLGPEAAEDPDTRELLDQFLRLRDQEQQELATDQLLSAVHLRLNQVGLEPEVLREAVLRPLDDPARP
ncbi:MoxR family ATPase [Streptacidiphilus sp. P02-A3a]|uniref:AAA family ATPase n=1 Tax=Streptacidiphilus sp. P02-A3a TaxID=2704468 RepID=UPI0015FA0F7B|nr:MoxR family ATPase [Streptacidiphilus sp. P02-A3a]